MNENEFDPVSEPVQKHDRNRRSPMEIIIAVAAVVLIVAMMAALVMGDYGDQPVTDPTEATGLEYTDATVPADGNAGDVTCKGTYTISDEDAKAAADQVVATMGDVQMTNADLQVYYYMEVANFLNEYGYYATLYGLDYTQPLDTQMSTFVDNRTWQQYFLETALSTWHTYNALAEEAKAVGFDQSSEDYRIYAESLRDECLASAESYGYGSIKAMLEDQLGSGVTEEAYLNSMKTSYLGYLYYWELFENRQPTDAEVEAYFDQYAADYAESGLDKETGNYVDIRHILIMPTGGTIDASGATTYSEAEWADAQTEAQKILDMWLAGDRTAESFGELAAEYTHDSNGADGGLYTNVSEGDMVKEFNDWCFDENRVTGDYGLVKTQYGWHVMYFEGSNPMWFATAKSDLETEIANAIPGEVMAKYEISYDYDTMVLGELKLS